MKLLYKAFRKLCMSTFNYKVYTAEVIHSFNNVINLNRLIRNTKSFCFKDIAGLIVSKL